MLSEPGQFVGYRGTPECPSGILLVNHGLHIEIQIDREHLIGQHSPAGVADILLESAITASRTARTRSPRSIPRTRSASIATGWV